MYECDINVTLNDYSKSSNFKKREKMKKIIMATAVGLLMVGCGESAPKEKVGSAPACGSNDVKTSVLANFKAELDEQHRLNSGIKAKEKFIAEYQSKLVKSGISERDKKYYEKTIKSYEQGIEQLKHYLEILNSTAISTIRTDTMDDKAKKSTCQAFIKISEPMHFMNPYTKYDITYSAYITSDGELFTEVNKFELNSKGEQYQYPSLK